MKTACSIEKKLQLLLVHGRHKNTAQQISLWALVEIIIPSTKLKTDWGSTQYMNKDPELWRSLLNLPNCLYGLGSLVYQITIKSMRDARFAPIGYCSSSHCSMIAQTQCKDYLLTPKSAMKLGAVRQCFFFSFFFLSFLFLGG